MKETCTPRQDMAEPCTHGCCHPGDQDDKLRTAVWVFSQWLGGGWIAPLATEKGLGATTTPTALFPDAVPAASPAGPQGGLHPLPARQVMSPAELCMLSVPATSVLFRQVMSQAEAADAAPKLCVSVLLPSVGLSVDEPAHRPTQPVGKKGT